MSYTVLARRYRSSTFDEVIGQEHVARTLKKAVATDRIAHAYLFCGTRGTGKTSMARILAKALNCSKSDKPTPEPCGTCNSCVAIARGDDMDVEELDAASNRGIDEVRKIIENSRYRPASSRFKVYIIDEVHGLTKDAFNALLKVLEEPSSHVKFILATTEPEKVLATILSRCQRFDFRNIPTREIAAHLKSVCKQEKVKADDDALLVIAKAGAGSMRDALSLLDRLLSLGETKLTAEMIEQLLGMPRSQVIHDLAGAIAGGNVSSVLAIASKLIGEGLSPDALVASLTEHLRNLMVLRVCGPETDMVEVPGLAREDLQEQAGRFDAAALSQDIVILEELRRALRTSQAGRALVDATLVRLALADQFVSVANILQEGMPAPAAQRGVPASMPAVKKNSEVRRTVAPPAPPTPASDSDDDLPRPGKVWDNSGPPLADLLKQQEQLEEEVAAASNVQPVDPADLGNVMARLRSAVHRHSPGIDGFLMHGELVTVDGGVAVIRYPADGAAAATMLERNGKKDIIQRELSDLLAVPVSVKFQVVPVVAGERQPPAARPRAVPAVRPVPAPQEPGQAEATPASIRITAELREELRAREPLIKVLIDELGAEIVKVE